MGLKLKVAYEEEFVSYVSDAWITTGGTNAGIMEIVGEAVREHMLQNGAFEQNVVVLGIVTWGIILNKAALRDNNVSGTTAIHLQQQQVDPWEFHALSVTNRSRFTNSVPA